MIKAVICDLGNVLAFFNRSITYKKFALKLGLSTGEVKEPFENSDIMEKYELGQMTSSEFHNEFLKIIGKPGSLSFEEFSRLYGDMFTPNTVLLDVLDRLKDKKLVMLSNTCEIHFEYIRDNFPQITNLFEDRLILSYKEGRAKPDQQSFAKALEFAGCSPCEALFIDDIPKYTDMAAEMGLHTLTYWPGAVISPTVIERFQCKCARARASLNLE